MEIKPTDSRNHFSAKRISFEREASGADSSSSYRWGAGNSLSTGQDRVQSLLPLFRRERFRHSRSRKARARASAWDSAADVSRLRCFASLSSLVFRTRHWLIGGSRNLMCRARACSERVRPVPIDDPPARREGGPEAGGFTVSRVPCCSCDSEYNAPMGQLTK